MPAPSIAILYHIFYEDTLGSICEELEPLKHLNSRFYFNVCQETPGGVHIMQTLRNGFPGCCIIVTSNKGKDIGGKLALFDILLRLGEHPDYILLLHDKKSLQALKSVRWKKELLKIIDAKNLQPIIERMDKTPSCGISATREYLITEPYSNNTFTGQNRDHLASLLTHYQISVSHPVFVAGTMFWARASPLLEFFTANAPLSIRASLECGNVIDNFSGTLTHAWERLLCWIITGKGFSIYPV